MKRLLGRARTIYGDLKSAWIVHRTKKLFSYPTAFRLWWQNRHLQSARFSLNDLARAKRTDILFIIASGPSLNDLTAQETSQINQHDVLGISYSFLREDIRARYHMFSWEDAQSVNNYRKVFPKYRESMKDAVILVSNDHFLRFFHPRIVPDLFPPEPKYSVYLLPSMIGVEKRLFADEDFSRSLRYRNILSMAIHLGVQMKYKKIVLIGVDPDKGRYFFDDHPDMREYASLIYSQIAKYPHVEKHSGGKMQFEYMYPHSARPHPFDVYLKSVASYLRRCRDIQLYVSHQSSVLYPDIPAYFSGTTGPAGSRKGEP